MTSCFKTLPLLVALVLVGCTNPFKQPETAAQAKDIAAIGQLADDWRAGWIDGDAEFLLSLYADKPVLMPQGKPAVFGKENIRPLYETVLQEVDVTSQTRLMDVEVSGDWGYFWCTYTLTVTPKAGGESFDVPGKSLFIVERQHDGAWKIARLIDNSDDTPADV